jgi:uncharacterized protein
MERVVWGFLTISLLLGFIFFSKQTKTCSDIYRKDISIKTAVTSIEAQSANNEQEREQGLGGKSCIGPNQGMLFVFDKPAGYSFWMKDMKFSIDIVWISADKHVVYEKTNVSPETYPESFSSPAAAKYVLEVGAGQADKLGLEAGKQLYY